MYPKTYNLTSRKEITDFLKNHTMAEKAQIWKSDYETVKEDKEVDLLELYDILLEESKHFSFEGISEPAVKITCNQEDENSGIYYSFPFHHPIYIYSPKYKKLIHISKDHKKYVIYPDMEPKEIYFLVDESYLTKEDFNEKKPKNMFKMNPKAQSEWIDYEMKLYEARRALTTKAKQKKEDLMNMIKNSGLRYETNGNKITIYNGAIECVVYIDKDGTPYREYKITYTFHPKLEEFLKNRY